LTESKVTPKAPLSVEERAEKAYTAWAAYQNNHINGLPARTYAQLGDEEKGSWIAAAKEI
jgi:hypothetical protein